MHKPIECHWVAVKHLVRCLKATSSFGLYLKDGYLLSLLAYGNVDWVGNKDDNTSTLGCQKRNEYNISVYH